MSLKEQKPNPIQRIVAVGDKIPMEMLEDINHRIADWVASGGQDTDPYVEHLASNAEMAADLFEKRP